MGEAKARRELLKRKMLVELERLMMPTSPAEDALNDEIRALNFYSIERLPADQLAYMKMQPQQCHQNAGVYARLDPTGESRHVSGWWKRGGILFFHSVVLTQTKLRCITPYPDPSPLEFAPDSHIEWREENGVMNATRQDHKVPFLIRDFPDRIIRDATAARDALAAGADPMSIEVPF